MSAAANGPAQTASNAIPPSRSSRHSRSNSISSSANTVKRTGSLSSAGHSTIKSASQLDLNNSVEQSQEGPAKLQKRPPGGNARRRSSVAYGAGELPAGVIREGVGNLNRWSQSTTSSKSSIKEGSKKEGRRNSFSRRLSIGGPSNFTSFNGAAVPHLSPTRKSIPSEQRSPGTSPRRKSQPRSPPPEKTSFGQIPPISTLPTLPATTFDPLTPSTLNSASPSTGLLTSGSHTAPDYFSTKPQARPAASPGRSSITSRSHGTRTPDLRKAVSTQGAGAGHTRDRSISDTSSRVDEGANTPPRSRNSREKDKKTMLSRALQKANTAVLLDNAQNFEGAMEAYNDACRLLRQVMDKTYSEEDKRKLDAIRSTYTSRIQELKQLDVSLQASTGKTLPARPMSDESLASESQSVFNIDGAEDENVVIETATMTRIVNDRSVQQPMPAPAAMVAPEIREDPIRKVNPRESVVTSAIKDIERTLPTTTSTTSSLLKPPTMDMGGGGQIVERVLNLESPMDKEYMPPPLSPRRLMPANEISQKPEGKEATDPAPVTSDAKRGSDETTSWLDTIDESGGSCSSSPSVHSGSSDRLRRKHLRTGSGDTEAEFDAALDAAVEAAYDEGFEPYVEQNHLAAQIEGAAATRQAELAKERMRELEREDAIAAAKERHRLLQQQKANLPYVRDSEGDNYPLDEADEEERLLDEMTKDYMMDGFDFGLQSKSALPRGSDSSGFSGASWNTSMSSVRTIGGRPLSSVAEVPSSRTSRTSPPTPPPTLPPNMALPTLPERSSMHPPTGALPKLPANSASNAASVRSRRLSGQNARSLKIETAAARSGSQPPQPRTGSIDIKPEPHPPAPKTAAPAIPGSQSEAPLKVPAMFTLQTDIARSASPQSALLGPPDTASTISPATPALSQAISHDSTLQPPGSPGFPKLSQRPSATGLRKNKSSLSLNNHKTRAMSISSPDGSEQGSVGTPMSTTFPPSQGRKPSISQAPVVAHTPGLPIFAVEGLSAGGMTLFEADIHSPYSPGSPNPLAINAPIPLEPCPDSYLLRPFWLMRCFYQTIAHPRGGYLSTKLFVPRDIWGVRNVKLKSVEEKISNCDLLTAGLMRLSAVNTLDADAVLEEMQALDSLLDQVQSNLVKKLGNDVGIHGLSSLFKDAPITSPDGSTDAPEIPKNASKSYLTSWRKLRNKNSSAGLGNKFVDKADKEIPSRDTLTMPTLPMTSLPAIRFAKRDMGKILFDGPNKEYMSALARLCDAVQILDQIARQVEDPGLKHSSKTHVGLELCARHAAEFFGLYVCRFVLSDVSLMLDKFIKRGSEWVLV